LQIPNCEGRELYFTSDRFSAVKQPGMSFRLTEPNEWIVSCDLKSGWFHIGLEHTKGDVLLNLM